MILVGADHGGYRLKSALLSNLRKHGFAVRDIGAKEFRPTDDYPGIARQVARQVARQPGARGILVCRSGVGMAIAANKIRGIRAVQGGTLAVARRSRREEDTNILTLAADFLTGRQATAIVLAWLREPFRPISRYRRRLQQLARLDHGV